MFTERSPYIEETGCKLTWAKHPAYALFQETTFFTLPVVLSAILNLVIGCLILKRRQTSVGVTKQTNRKSQETRTLMALLGIALVTLVCWVPATVYYFLLAIDGIVFNLQILQVVLAFQQLATIINPIVYHRTLPDIRRAIHELFLGWNRVDDVRSRTVSQGQQTHGN